MGGCCGQPLSRGQTQSSSGGAHSLPTSSRYSWSARQASIWRRGSASVVDVEAVGHLHDGLELLEDLRRGRRAVGATIRHRMAAPQVLLYSGDGDTTSGLTGISAPGSGRTRPWRGGYSCWRRLAAPQSAGFQVGKLIHSSILKSTVRRNVAYANSSASVSHTHNKSGGIMADAGWSVRALN